MIRRVFTTLALAATVGAALAACNSSPVTSPSPKASFGPVATPAASDMIQASPSFEVSPSPMQSALPSAS